MVFMSGGLVLVRVERTLFKIPAYVLSEASPIFCGMLTLPQPGEAAEPAYIRGVTAQAFTTLLDFLLNGKRTFALEALLDLLYLSDRFAMDRVLAFSINHIVVHPTLTDATLAHISYRFSVERWILPMTEWPDMATRRFPGSSLHRTLSQVPYDEVVDWEHLVPSERHYHTVPPVVLRVDYTLYRVPLEAAAFVNSHFAALSKVVTSAYPSRGADVDNPIILRANNAPFLLTLFNFLWTDSFDLNDESQEDMNALLNILEVVSVPTFRCEVIRNYAIDRLSEHPLFRTAHKLAVARRQNVWQWVIPCLEDLLSLEFFEHEPQDFARMMEVGGWFIGALSDERNWIETSSRSIIAGACPRVEAVTCVTRTQCDVAWGTWWGEMWRRKLLVDSLSPEDAVAELVGSETGPRGVCRGCFTLSLANLMQMDDWSPLQPSRTLRYCAMRLRKRFCDANPRKVGPRVQTTHDADAVNPLVGEHGASYDYLLW